MRRSLSAVGFTLVILFGLALRPAAAITIGMVADGSNGMVTVFNADTDTVLGSAGPLPNAGFIGDCVISTDKRTGYVTNFGGTVFLIDLTTTPPTLKSGVNPIAISNPGEDVTLTPRGEYLLTCDGSADAPVSVVLTQKRLEIGTFDLGSDCMAVDACANARSTNSSVLVGSELANNVRRLRIDASGQVVDTGDVLSNANTVNLNNVNCSPQGTTGVAVNFNPTQIQSFTIPGLAPVDNRTPTDGNALSGAFNSAGTTFYVRSGSNQDGSGAVDAFTYNPTTAALGAAPFFTIPIIQASNSAFGVEQLAVHPTANKLYVPQPNALNVYNATTGAPLTPITNPNIVDPTGVCVRQ
ncbi:MAG: hypothetical protein ACREQQ_10405 [Candidatus Binatia bacterium]